VREITVPFGRSLRVVQFTDLHAGIFTTRAEIGRCVDEAISFDPDLLVLTGDYISNSLSFLPDSTSVEESAPLSLRCD